MNQEQPNKTLVIGGREMAIGVVALAVISAVIAAIILILGQSDPPGTADAALTATITSQPTAVIPAANTINAVQPTGSMVLAPTLAPTAAIAEHTVLEGDSLISIAVL